MAERSAMGTLKDATSAHHARVEAVVGLPARCVARASYARLLADLSSFYADVEPRLLSVAGLSAVVPDLPERAKLPWLQADLEALGAVSHAETRRISLDLPDVDAALGCLYVLEGATLGGAQIARAVGRAHGLSASHGAAFFSSYGARRGERWRTFGIAVEAHAAARGALPLATVATARATFDAFAMHLTPTPQTEIAA